MYCMCLCVLCFVREKDDRPLDLNLGSSFWARSTLLLMDFPFPSLRSACLNSAKARRSKRNLAFFADDWLLPLFECWSLDISRSSMNFFSWNPVCVLWYNCCLISPLHTPILLSLSNPIRLLSFIPPSDSIIFLRMLFGWSPWQCLSLSRARKANEMKTDFKVKKVQMPAQNALEEKGEEVTHRKSLGDGWRVDDCYLKTCFFG